MKFFFNSSDLNEALSAKEVDFFRKIHTQAMNNSYLTIETHLGLTAEQERQLFADLNSRGRRVPLNISHDFDRSDAVNVFIKDKGSSRVEGYYIDTKNEDLILKLKKGTK